MRNSDYTFVDGKFILNDYDTKKTFYSFLPGIAGIYGIPIWSFYLNRGQGLSSFGIKSKGSPIMEFLPAIIANEKINTQGFRTFLKIGNEVFEPFAVVEDRKGLTRQMSVSRSSFSVLEKNEIGGYEIEVTYCVLPMESVGGLIRNVRIKNLRQADVKMEVCDGTTIILPYGMTNMEYETSGNLLRSWAETSFVDDKILFTKQRASTIDGSEITLFDQGNFYYSEADGKTIKPIGDIDLVFGYDKSLKIPFGFKKHGVGLTIQPQIFANKISCGFTVYRVELQSGGESVINTLIGNASSSVALAQKAKDFSALQYFEKKIAESATIIDTLTDEVKTHTAFEVFDAYIENSYLDNMLRGGYPILLDKGGKDFVYYIYSRKHGDMERDYNWFDISPEFFSQGEGNYRDVNQNRRSDVLINPFVKDFNIKLFLSLIQADGYNPHNIRSTTFEIADKSTVKKIAAEYAGNDTEFVKIISNRFTPGSVINYLYRSGIETTVPYKKLLGIVLSEAEQHIESSFKEGYWVDHWTYNLDLIESYEKVYPDRINDLLFTDFGYRYFYSPVYVRSRAEKYVLNNAGVPHQYKALDIDDNDSVANKIGTNRNATSWLCDSNGKEISVNLISKLFSLLLIKFATMDCDGLGIEMEADRVGWNDAMNGLAGIFGSGMSETIELYRLLTYIAEKVDNVDTQKILLLREQYVLLQKVLAALKAFHNEAEYWDAVSVAREEYRKKIALGKCNGELVALTREEFEQAITAIKAKLTDSMRRAKEIGGGLYPTYFYYEPKSYSLTDNANKRVKVDGFKRKVLPLFLEALARNLKVASEEEGREQYAAVKKSDLYDANLGLYKTCESLENESFEIGRIKQFTPGHLEREACFLHMTYKYLLGLLCAGLYEEFFEAVSTNFVPFMKAEVYGRSVLENSSFIATSNNPDPNVVGQGFYARLTGANAEVISMWHIMMFGKRPFYVENGNLICRLKPVLKAEFFDRNNEVSSTFLGKTQVTYVNAQRKNTYDGDCSVEKIELYAKDNKRIINGDKIFGEEAEKVRNNEYDSIKIYLR